MICIVESTKIYRINTKQKHKNTDILHIIYITIIYNLVIILIK